MAGLQNLTATTLRNIAGEMELDQLLTSRDQINQKLETILDQATDAWGIKVTRVELKNIQPPKEIAEVMTKQMRAERERRQTVLEAQAFRLPERPKRKEMPRSRWHKAAPSRSSWFIRQRRTALKPLRTLISMSMS